MAKHGKELSDDTKKDIIKLNESGYRARQVAQSLTISKSTISRLLKRCSKTYWEYTLLIPE
jgi:IS30 family transposase